MRNSTQNTGKAAFLDRVWNDDAYRARLQEDPKAALTELGGDVPDGLDIRCVMDTDKVKYLHIPEAPPEGEISDEDLLQAQGGTTIICGVTAITVTMTVVNSAIVTLTIATTDE
ncbi:MAG: nitrile hydratase subunit alpha [Paracoccaceae bacterium]